MTDLLPDPNDLEERMNAGHLTPFDLPRLHTIPLPQRLCDRTCAVFNGDHLVVSEPAGGDPEPLPDQTLLLQPAGPRFCLCNWRILSHAMKIWGVPLLVQ